MTRIHRSGTTRQDRWEGLYKDRPRVPGPIAPMDEPVSQSRRWRVLAPAVKPVLWQTARERLPQRPHTEPALFDWVMRGLYIAITVASVAGSVWWAS